MASSASEALEALVACAEAIQDRNLKLADSLLERIWNLAADLRKSDVVKFFAEALVRRAYGLSSPSAYFTLLTPPALTPLYFLPFDAIKTTACMGKKRFHLITFCLPLDLSDCLFGSLYTASGDSLSVRISVIVSPFLEKIGKIYQEKSKQDLTAKALRLGIKLEDLRVVYANSLGDVDASKSDFTRTKDETVIVYYQGKLHQLLADARAMERELLKLRQINPEIVIIEEQHADHNDPNFIKRLQESFQYCGPLYSSHCMRCHRRRQIGNIVECEGRDRLERHQTWAQWRSLLLANGLLQVPLRPHTPCFLYEDNGCLVFRRWVDGPISFISAWKHRDAVDHFNPISYNRVQGFNPNPASEDTVRPLQVDPLASSLNRLAGFAEIYDMLEDVCLKYELPLALTWVKRTPNRSMSSPNEKHFLSIETTCSYINYYRYYYYNEIISKGSFVERCAKRNLLERQAIAGQALQSKEPFLFEPNITRLRDYPFAQDALDSGLEAVLAICLVNRYDSGDVYILEFFLPPFKEIFEEPKSLALRIFEDVKNMKKKFVKLRVDGTEVGLQEEAIPNIPRAAMPMRSSPPASSNAQFLNSNALHQFTVPGDDYAVLEIQGLNEQESGKQTFLEPIENEKVKAYVNDLSISSAKGRKLRSDVWDEFTKEKYGDGKECAKCSHCGREFDGSSRKGTSHLRNHLEHCKSKRIKIGDKQGNSSKVEDQQGNSSFDHDRSRMDVARMIIKHQCPLNIVEDEYFSTLLKNLQPRFKLQSQEILSSDIFRVYKAEKDRLLEYFDKLSCRFNLTISLWANDLEKITHCYFTVQFIDDNWELKKKVLALKNLGSEFDTRIFLENFKRLLRDWNFNVKVCSLIIHNSSSNLEIAEEIRKAWLCFQASHPLSTFYIRCDGCINGLLAKDQPGGMLQDVGKSIDGAVKTSSSCLLDIYNKYNKLSQQERKGYPLMNVISDNNWRTCSLVLAIAAILDPRFKFDFVEFSYNKIYGYDAARIHLAIIRSSLTDIFNEYASNMYSGTSVFDDTNSLALLNGEESTMKSFNRWKNSKRNVNTEASWNSEFDRYDQEPEPVIPMEMEFNVLVWWGEHASRFPFLGRMARDILAIPMSSIVSVCFEGKSLMDNSNIQ
ncbi:uncharacterized protein LOC110422300 [Herrania umbratica]|uniref:Uncharacterized protein LOC110422300 n=1 Tax=Herrania umbratica TaxID=108875 RepID=A0A6J1AXE5_9ROSI|nr:uncharacterized protein LOC110422300 [Herrania umbratica]